MSNLDLEDTPIIGMHIIALKLEDNAFYVSTYQRTLKLWDNGQSCCESRYMTCDDLLDQFIGATVKGIEIRESNSISNIYGEDHDIEFLVIITDKGNITISNHNEHNGYYGGFSLSTSWMDNKN